MSLGNVSYSPSFNGRVFMDTATVEILDKEKKPVKNQKSFEKIIKTISPDCKPNIYGPQEEDCYTVGNTSVDTKDITSIDRQKFQIPSGDYIINVYHSHPKHGWANYTRVLEAYNAASSKDNISVDLGDNSKYKHYATPGDVLC